MRVTVLGAGVIGVTTAWYLLEAGHEVTVVDRQPQPARETSFANGGQISVSHAEPWANPQAPLKVLKWLGREDAPLLFRPRADLAQWIWGLRFLRECLPARTRTNTLAILSLAQYSGERLRALRDHTGIQYHCLARGILHLFTDEAGFARVPRRAQLLRDHGLPAEVLSPAECVRLEPALAECRVALAGGLYGAHDESGDARVFTERLASLAVRRGARFLLECNVKGLEGTGNRIVGAKVTWGNEGHETLTADAWVVCLGSYSPLLLAPLGERLPIYPVKGYSVTVPTGPSHLAPTVSITDEERKLVFSRLGDRLRIAGTAELAGYDTTLNISRCRPILDRAFGLFPRAGDRTNVEYWTGLRPATPGNVPLVGRTRYENLFLNTGHGTLGWTLSCGSAAALADIVSGRAPQVDFPFRGGTA